MPSRTEILRAIKDAEQIANDLDCGQASFAKNTFLREDCRKPLIAAYNELYQAAGPQARITIKLKHLLSVMGRMYADALPSRYADSIRGYCSEIRDYLKEKPDHTTGDGKQTTDDRLLPAKQIRDLLPELFPSWKVQQAFLESHPEVTAERRGQHWFIDLHQLVSAKLKDQTGEITDKAIDTYLDGVKERKAEIDAKRNRQRK